MRNLDKKKEDLIRIHDERLAIFEFGRLVERSVGQDKEFEEIFLDFNKPCESPDAVLRIKEKKGEYSLNVEFEGYSSNFKTHGHDKTKCHLIICSLHDWKDSPLPVLETCYGNMKIINPYEGTKGTVYEQFRKLMKK